MKDKMMERLEELQIYENRKFEEYCYYKRLFGSGNILTKFARDEYLEVHDVILYLTDGCGIYQIRIENGF